MKTIREFAEEQHVSYEAIRKQLSVYSMDLKGHIVKKGRVQYLDEFAIEFLRKKRRDNPVIVEVQDNREEMEQLKADNEKLKNQIMLLQQQLIEAEKERNSMIEYKIRNEYLLESHNRDQAELKEIRGQLKTTDQALTESKIQLERIGQELTYTMGELQEAKNELDSFSLSWFGFYRKK